MAETIRPALTCGECIYAHRHVTGATCHRHAPTPSKSNDHRSLAWPRVALSDWCGEGRKGDPVNSVEAEGKADG